MKTNILSVVSQSMAVLLLAGGVSVAQVPERPARPEIPQPSSLPGSPSMTPAQAQAIIETRRLQLQQQGHPAAHILQPTPLAGAIGGGVQQPGAINYARAEPMVRINLDFPGGTPQQLVSAIEKATGEPLNAIIPEQDKDVVLPALKMRQVTVEDLFVGMEQASRRTEIYVTGTYYSAPGGPNHQYSQAETSFGFRKVGTVWVFSNKTAPRRPDLAPVTTRFYQLSPYLERNSVEDITTAIHTAWKMMADANRGTLAELKFHKETGLLIAVGDSAKVQMIDDVLSALSVDPVTGLPVKPSRKANVPPKKTTEEH